MADCPKPIPTLGMSLSDSIDAVNCGCRTITADVSSQNSYTLNWTDASGNPIAGNTNNSIYVCPSSNSVYHATVTDDFSTTSQQISVGPPTACDQKKVTVCTQVFISTLNDLLKLHDAATQSLPVSNVSLSYSSAYDGQCVPSNTNYGSAKLNAFYRFNYSSLENYFYKVMPLPLSCSFVFPGTPEHDNIQAPVDADFINGRPSYLSSGEKIFANHIYVVPGDPHAIIVNWSGVTSSFGNIGVCPPEERFMNGENPSILSNEVYPIYFFTINPGCTYLEANENASCRTYVKHAEIKRIYNLRVAGSECDAPLITDYDFAPDNVAVTIEMINGSIITAYLQNSDGTAKSKYFKFKENKTGIGCQ